MKLIRVPLIVLIIHFAIVQISKIEGVSMQKTLFEGDYVFISQFSYGVPIPKLYKYDLQLFPDFFNNGHLISGDGPEYGDIVTIEHKKNDKYEHYVKTYILIRKISKVIQKLKYGIKIFIEIHFHNCFLEKKILQMQLI